MKKVIVFAFAVLCCISISFGHSGRTDASGGHYDRQYGGYHYHHGYPAHDHKGGKCPYIEAQKEQAHKKQLTKTIFLYSLLCCVGACMCYKLITKCAKIHAEHQFVKNRGAIKLAAQLKQQLQEIQQRRLELQKKSYLSPRKVCNVPDDSFLDAELLPCTTGTPAPFGEYTVFYNGNTGKYHFAHCVYAGYGRKTNICQIPIYAKPCFRCVWSAPPLDWIEPYREYMAAFKVIGINPDNKK